MTATVVTNGVDMSGASVEVAARLTGPGVGTYDLPTNVTFSMGSVLSLGTGVEMSSEVNDPRLNGSPTSWVINTLGSTIGTTNSISTPGDDGAVYIADSAAHGGIQNAGELGYLWIPGRPWESIDLMGAHAALLDRFTVHTNEFVHGLVNINSDDPQVLATALYGARNEICPGAESTGLSWPDALTLAATISANRPPHGYPAKSAIASLAEFSNETFGPQPTENHKESLVRLCSDMMDVRGNTHFVVLAVRAVRDRTSPSNDDPNGTWDGEGVDFTLGEQFAVAQVWRDPVTQQSQVTFFKWIARTD
jgi:hypothetical protein